MSKECRKQNPSVKKLCQVNFKKEVETIKNKINLARNDKIISLTGEMEEKSSKIEAKAMRKT